ncbi:MAG: Pyrimidine operon regulatory protein PyrR, partial [uncultured Nocardioidaceae bacterium]
GYPVHPASRPHRARCQGHLPGAEPHRARDPRAQQRPAGPRDPRHPDRRGAARPPHRRADRLGRVRRRAGRLPRRDDVPRRPAHAPGARPAAHGHPARRDRRQGRGAGRRRALLRPHDPRGAGRDERRRPSPCGAAGGPRRPRPPRPADPRRLRRQEPAHLGRRDRDRPARRDRGRGRGADHRPRRDQQHRGGPGM